MTNRRQFIQSSFVVSALSLTQIKAISAMGSQGLDRTEILLPGLEYFVFDKRFEEVAQVALRAKQKGITLGETSGDMTELWYDHLDLQWKQKPMLLSGMTAPDGLFVLETLANDHGMRVKYRANYTSTHHETLVAWIIAPKSLRINNVF